MRLDEFRDLAARFGGDIERWPERERAAARALLEASSAATTVLSQARDLDRLIEAVRPEVSAARVERAIGGVARRLAAPVRSSWWQRFAPLLAPATSFACAAAIGIALGLTQPAHLPTEAGADALVALILDGAPVNSGWFY